MVFSSNTKLLEHSMLMNVKEMKVAQSHITSVAIKGKMLLRVNKKVLHWVILATNSEKIRSETV